MDDAELGAQLLAGIRTIAKKRPDEAAARMSYLLDQTPKRTPMQDMTNPVEQCVVDEPKRDEPRRDGPDMSLYLIAFNDGSYKKIRAVSWKHSQWMHFTLEDGTVIRVNPDKVNYLHQGITP